MCITRVGDAEAGGAVERPRVGSGAWYAMELTEPLPHITRGLNINWDEATRYAGLNAEF